MNGMTTSQDDFWAGANTFFSESGFAIKLLMLLVGAIVVFIIITLIIKIILYLAYPTF